MQSNLVIDHLQHFAENPDTHFLLDDDLFRSTLGAADLRTLNVCPLRFNALQHW